MRLQAINNVEAYVPPAFSFDPAEAPGEIFGANVFTKAEMQLRLPKSVYKSVVATVEKGAKLDPAVADAVASVMKDSRVTRGRTSAVVYDAATGSELFQRSGGRASIPASNTKIVTALAAGEVSCPLLLN